MSRPVVAERNELSRRSEPLPVYLTPAQRSVLRRASINAKEAFLGLEVTIWDDEPADDEPDDD